jgi:serine/threonine protein kinase
MPNLIPLELSLLGSYKYYPDERFQIEALVGEGSYGKVFKAYDTEQQKVSEIRKVTL